MPADTDFVATLLGDKVSTAAASTSFPRHRWYSVKESFSSILVEAAIEHEGCGEGDLILDPFCGGGTVPVTAALRGLSALGIEVNPFLAFVSKAKLSRLSSGDFRRRAEEVVAGVTAGAPSALDGYSTFTKARNYERGLFNQKVLTAFEGGWKATDSLPRGVSGLMRLALIGSAMDRCNAVRDGKALRYRKSLFDADFDAESLLHSLDGRMTQIADDLAVDIPEKSRASIWTGDSRKRLSALGNRRFKLCVTSPPYLNSFDYSDVYRPELFLGGFVRSTTELKEVRLRTIRSHLQTSWKKPRATDFGPRFEACWSELRDRIETLWDRRIPVMVQAYFEDMKLVLEKLRHFAAPHASVWLVVSTSAYGGVEIPVDLILADIGCQAGWYLREVHVVRQLRSSGQHWKSQGASGSESRKLPPLRESVVIFDDEPRQSS